QEWIFFWWQRPVRKDRLCAPALRSDGAAHQLFNNSFQPRVIETFAQRLVELDAQPLIDGIELCLRKMNHLAPDREIINIPRLQFHEFTASDVERSLIKAWFVGIALAADRFIDPFQFSQRISFELLPIQKRLPNHDQHPEL